MADTETDRTERLGSLFVSVTGSDSVVESQEEESSTREVRDETDGGDGITDSTSFHGLDDAIEDPEPTVEAGS